MNRAAVVATLLALALASSVSAEIAPICKILPQLEAPVAILAYTCHFQSNPQAVGGEGIEHNVEYANIGSGLIEAIQIDFVSFDVWNEFLDRTSGLAMSTVSPKMKKKGTWTGKCYDGFAFLTGVAYVSKVRYRDGSLWMADVNAIATAMQEIEAGFHVELLTKKKTEDS